MSMIFRMITLLLAFHSMCYIRGNEIHNYFFAIRMILWTIDVVGDYIIQFPLRLWVVNLLSFGKFISVYPENDHACTISSPVITKVVIYMCTIWKILIHHKGKKKNKQQQPTWHCDLTNPDTVEVNITCILETRHL